MMKSPRYGSLFVLVTTMLVLMADTTESFHMVMMARRGKGGLKQNLEDTGKKRKGVGSLNQGKGQEITGVTLPANGMSCFVVE